MAANELIIPPEWYDIYFPRFTGSLWEFEVMMYRVLRKRLKRQRVRWNARAKRLNRRAQAACVPGLITGKELKEIVDYYDSKCAYCEVILDFNKPSKGKFPTCSTFDHVIPMGRGGRNDKGNIVCACLQCNAERSRWPNKALKVPAPRGVHLK